MDGWDYDITAVYRVPEGSAISFLDYKDEEPIYERADEDPIFERDEEEHLAINIPDIFRHRPSVEKKEQIRIVTQAFYGNRTATEIEKDELDGFVLGCLDAGLFESMHKEEEIDRTVVRIPGAEYLALIYNKYQEQKRLEEKEECFQEEGYVMKPLATIPELGLNIYSRCIVCRMDAEGEPASLEPEDYELFMEYLAK